MLELTQVPPVHGRSCWCVLGGESVQCLLPRARKESGAPSFHTLAKPRGRKRQRQGGGAGQGALTWACLRGAGPTGEPARLSDLPRGTQGRVSCRRR